MPDCMMPFPEDWHDFLKDYSFDDSQEVYTNGSRLIPVFRVEQLIKHLLKAQEPRVMTLEEVKALQPDTDIWIEVRYLNAPIRIRACTVSGFSPGGTRLFIIGGAHNYPMDMYNNYFRCWTSRSDQATREATPWN